MRRVHRLQEDRSSSEGPCGVSRGGAQGRVPGAAGETAPKGPFVGKQRQERALQILVLKSGSCYFSYGSVEKVLPRVGSGHKHGMPGASLCA